MKSRVASLVLSLGLVSSVGSLIIGCAKPVPHLPQGQPYATGQSTYDDFFTAVLALRADGQHAREDEEATRASLLTVLGLEPQASATLAVGEAELRAKKLRDVGVSFHVDLVPEAKVVAAKPKGVANLEADDLAKAAESSTKSAIALSQRLGAVSARAVELEKIRVDLRAQAPATFRGEPQAHRDEITLELDSAAGVLTEASDAAERWGGVAAKFALDLARALDAGSGGAPAEPAPSARGTRGVASKPSMPLPHDGAAVRPAPAAQPATGSATAAPAKKPPAAAPPSTKPAAAAPPPKKKPKGGDDFEP